MLLFVMDGKLYIFSVFYNLANLSTTEPEEEKKKNTQLTRFSFQARLRRPRRTGLLLPRRHPHCYRRLSVERARALLQGSRHCE